MSDWTTFNETHVYPAMFDRIDEILPEFGFVDGGTATGKNGGTCRVKKSRIHVDDLTRNKDKDLVTYLYDNGNRGLFDHARKTSASTADVYARLHNMDWQAAMAEITERLGLSHLAPKPTGHYDDSPEAAYKRAVADFEPFLQEERDQAQEIFTRRLWDDAAKPSGKDTVLAFMKGRGWTEEHIKAAGLGMYVNAMNGDMPEGMAISLRQQGGSIGKTHILTIPYHAYGRIYSFGFRHLGGPGTEHLRSKYTNVKGVPMNRLVGIRRGVQHAIIVEGWLDHLAAKVRGVDNVFATITSTATVKMLDDAIDNARVREFTLMLDNDIAGITGARKAIEHLRNRGIPCYIGRYPQDVKDLDEFFNVHGGTVEEFKGIVNNAESGHTFATEIIIRSTVSDIYQATNGQKYQPREIDDATAEAFVKEYATPRQREDLRDEIVRHLVATPPAERLEALRCIPAWADAFKLDAHSLLEASTGDEARRQRQAEEEANKLFKDIFMKAGKALRKGDIALAKKLTAEAAQAAVPATVDDIDDMIIFSSLEKLREHARERPDGILTGYTFKENKKKNPRETRLRLNPGLTFITASTGHGKTSFLNNIIINVAKRNYLEYQAAMDKFSDAEREGNPGDLKQPKVKSVFYMSLEEEADVLQAKLLNVYCNDPNINPAEPDRAILDWFRNGTPENRHPLFYEQLAIGDPDTAKDQYARFCAKAEGFNAILKSGALALCEKARRLEDVTRVINRYMDKYDTALVCIDYVQKMSPEGGARYEEIKKIVNDLADIAKLRKTPFLLASQFNRKVMSPLDLCNANAGEGGDIERIADTHIGLFNLQELKRAPRGGEHGVKEGEIEKLLKEAYVPQGWTKKTTWSHGETIEGYMFATLLKCRGGLSGLDIILPFNGPTRKIALNDLEYCKEIGEDTPPEPTHHSNDDWI